MILDNLKIKEIGYLVGLFLGDGYSNYNKKDRHYKVVFSLNSKRDKEIINYLISLLNSLQLKAHRSKDKRSLTEYVIINSKNLMFFFEEKVKKFKSRKETNTDYLIGMLSGFIDADGYVNNGEIVLTQKNKEILIIFKEFLDKIDLSRKFWFCKNYKSRNNIWRLRISTKFKYLPHNSYKVRRVYGGE